MPAAVDAGVGAHHLTDFEDLLQPAQIVLELELGDLLEKTRNRGPELPERRLEAELEVNFRALIARRPPELHRAVVADGRVLERAPGDALVRAIADDLGFPFEARPDRTLGVPRRVPVAFRHALHVPHEE